MAIVQTKPITVRDPGPYPAKRPCANCGAHLRTDNPGPLCEPCDPKSPKDYGALYERISEMPDVRQRRIAFEALAEYVDEQ